MQWEEQIRKTKVDSHSRETMGASGVSVIAAGTLQRRRAAVKDMKEQRGRMEGNMNKHKDCCRVFPVL